MSLTSRKPFLDTRARRRTESCVSPWTEYTPRPSSRGSNRLTLASIRKQLLHQRLAEAVDLLGRPGSAQIEVPVSRQPLEKHRAGDHRVGKRRAPVRLPRLWRAVVARESPRGIPAIQLPATSGRMSRIAPTSIAYLIHVYFEATNSRESVIVTAQSTPTH